MYATGTAGSKLQATVLVQNQTLVDADLVVDRLDMEAGTGDSTAFEYVPLGDAARGAGSWFVATPSSFRLAAGTQREVQIEIRVPDGAGAGGHFGALMFTARETRPSSQFNIDVATPVPVFVTVAGAYERDLRVRVLPDERWRWSAGPLRWTVEMYNAGDVHEPVSGRVRIDGLLSNASSTPVAAGILLPGERRRQRIAFNVRDAPDRLVAAARVDLDDRAAETARAPAVYLLPWWLLVLMAIIIVVVVWRVRSRRTAWIDDDGEPSEHVFPPVG